MSFGRFFSNNKERIFLAVHLIPLSILLSGMISNNEYFLGSGMALSLGVIFMGAAGELGEQISLITSKQNLFNPAG